MLASYSSGRGTRDSIGVAEEVSSAQETCVGGEKPLNRFQYSSMPKNSRPKFVSFQFVENDLESLVRRKFPPVNDGDGFTFDEMLDRCTANLTKLRSIIYSAKWVEGIDNTAAWTELRLQAFMQLFLKDMFASWDSNLTALGANDDEIEFELGGVKWKGYTDIMCCPRDGMPYVSLSTSNTEMKVAFAPHSSRLYHSEARGPKQQLLGQAIGLLTAGKTHVLSYLTDIIAMSVMYHVKGVAFLSERVTGAKACCLRLMLQCLNIDINDWSGLLPKQDDMVDMAIDDDEEEQEHRDVPGCSATRGQHPHTRCMDFAAGADDKENPGGKCHKLGCEEQDARERRMADISNLKVWEAKCSSHGVPYLGFDALNSNTFGTI